MSHMHTSRILVLTIYCMFFQILLLMLFAWGCKQESKTLIVSPSQIIHGHGVLCMHNIVLTDFFEHEWRTFSIIIKELRLAETAFNPEYGLFRVTEDRLLFPNPEAWKYHEARRKAASLLVVERSNVSDATGMALNIKTTLK